MKNPLLLLLLPALGCSADRDDPQKLFHRMERALMRAETIQMTSSVHSSRITFQFESATRRFRYERSNPYDKTRTIVSDGQRIRSSEPGDPLRDVDPADPAMKDNLVQEIIRGGLIGIERGRWVRRTAAPPLTGFKLLRHERKGFRSTAVVEVGGRMPTTFWIDERSGKLLKVERTFPDKCGAEIVVETYDEVRLDEGFPEGQFAVEFTVDPAPSSGPAAGRP